MTAQLQDWFQECRPVRLLEWQEEEGRATVFRPRFGGRRWGRRLAGWLGLSDYRIRLDPVGTLVWKHCDGTWTAPRMAQLLRERFGEQVEPAEERLQRFLVQMHRARMVVFTAPGGRESPRDS